MRRLQHGDTRYTIRAITGFLASLRHVTRRTAGRASAGTLLMRGARLILVLALLLLSGCAGGSSGSPPLGKPDPNTMIDVTGSIGSVKARETRPHVEQLLGRGRVTSNTTHGQKVGGTYTLTRVRYAASQLVIVYVTAAGRPPVVFGIFTRSPRYRTADGLHVGSTLSQAPHEPGIRCYPQPGYYDCQGGLGYEKPVTSFTVKQGRVVRVFVAAVAD